ncbi:monovalent cation:proton antiporter family protein [Thalassobacillus pellis]|uniref:monovalent cation:proton antiporter family protein n=1 Tax=Thalassobacillus pellis TaxID=748008 RepID=UPI0019619606|nr:monovalent cation:proton antiporter family protein [Thalassobacillus pellis]MBM7554011.1 CPA2 family monovalent cation:H+ antiporter-2 [Thalassobacillus pellis]
MEHGASVTSLVIVIIAAFITPIIMHRLKLKVIPVVVAEIIVGLIIGKSGFDIVEPGSWIEILSTLGFIFLMFLSGLEIDFSIFGKRKKSRKQSGNGVDAPNPVLIASLIFACIFVLSLGLSYLFVWGGLVDNAFLMTLIISTISLGVVVPTLKEAHMMKSTIGQTILLIAVIADLATMILLAVFVSLYGEGESNMWLLLVLFGAGVLIYFIGKYYRHQSFMETMTKGTIQIDTRAVFTLIIVLVSLSETVGAENILGAFLAGTLVSLLSPNPELVKRMDSFGYGFLIPIFFVMVGVKIDIWSLIQEPKVMILIPLLFIALFISKIVPTLILRKWYDWRTVMGSGFLLTSTLSLVIAAATIAEREGLIDNQMEGALILLAVLTCLVTPMAFKKIYGRFEEEHHVQLVSFVGSNRMTLPVVRELDSKQYETHLYHTKVDKIDDKISRSCFDIKELDSYDPEAMKQAGVYDVDILVASTGNDEKNAEIARYAKELGVERVIVRVESPELEKELTALNIDVFSVFLSTKALLKAMIVAPDVVEILTDQDSALYQINMNNAEYDGVMLREFPFTGDVIMVRIFRGEDSIVPHGDTRLRLNDHLIVTGSPEYVEELKMQLEYWHWS